MRVLKFTPLSLISPSSAIVLHAALPALAIMNMLSPMTEWVRNGVGGCSVGESGGCWSSGGGRGWEAVGSHSLLSFGAKREKALQGERSLAALQWLASRRPHCVPAECPQWARPHCLHFDLSTEDHCSPVSTTPLIYSFLLLLTPPPPHLPFSLYFGNVFITAKTEMFQNWFVKALGLVCDQTTSGRPVWGFVLCFFFFNYSATYHSPFDQNQKS